MSVASRPLDRPLEAGSTAAGRSVLLGKLEVPLLPLGVAGSLAGPTALFWPGCLLLLLGWLARCRAVGGRLDRRSPLDVGWLAVLAGSLVGFAISPIPSAALGRLAAVVAALSLFFWLRDRVQTPAGLRLASWALVAASGLGSLAILALIKGQLPSNLVTRLLSPLLGLFAAFPGISGDVLEVNSRFPVHQYGLAYLLLVATPFLVAEAALGVGRTGRWLAALGALGLTTLLAATEARGALLALALGVALVAGLRSRWFWGLLPLGALALYLLLARGIISRSIEADWLNTRLSIWTRSLNLLADYPFSGAGLGMQTFAEVFAWNFGLPNPYQVVHSHNVLIQAYAEQGLLGLVGLLLILVGGLLLAWGSARTAPPAARAASAGVLGALAASLLYGLTDQVPTTNDGLAILAWLCALAVAGGRGWESGRRSLSRSPRGSQGDPRPLPRSPALPLAAAALLVLGAAPRWGSGLALNVGAAQLTAVALGGPMDAEQKSAALGRAETVLGTAVAWNPFNVSAYRELARTRLLRHDVPGAVAALDRASASGGLNDYERTQLGRIYFELGFWQQAFDLWQAAGQSAQLRQAADDLAAKRDFKGAAAAHAALVELNPDTPENLSNLAKAILAAEGTVNVDEAMGWFDRAAQLNPEARRSLARQLVLQAEPYRINERRGGGRLDLAVFWFGLASRVDPTFDKPEVELGSVYYYAGRYPEAADHFRAALGRDAQNSSSWHQLGQAEAAAGRWPEAVAAFEQAARVAPNRAGLRLSLGHAYALTGRCDAAHRELAEALRLSPEGDSAARAQAELASASGGAECR
jgi:tetratricopeptide (TPR) repeat protein/O-antigen ligase